MTCLEKLKQDHPDFTADKISEIVEDECPSDYGIMKDPDNFSLCSDHCDECWNREIPNTEKKSNLQEAMEKLQADATKRFMESLESVVSTIKDSGSRTEFSTGAVRDIQEGKGRCDLMPLDVVADYMEDPIFLKISEFQRTGQAGHLYGSLRDVPARVNYADFPTMLLEVSKHFEEGAKKYGENNWQKGIPVRCYINSAVRHYLKWLRGDKDEPHDRAFCWNILCAIWTCKHKPELNDYAVKDGG